MKLLREETNKETMSRILKLTNNNNNNYGLLPPPMDAKVALIELAHHLLGEDWISINPISSEQINTEIVFEIERKYNIRKVPLRRR